MVLVVRWVVAAARRFGRLPLVVVVSRGGGAHDPTRTPCLRCCNYCVVWQEHNTAIGMCGVVEVCAALWPLELGSLPANSDATGSASGGARTWRMQRTSAKSNSAARME